MIFRIETTSSTKLICQSLHLKLSLKDLKTGIYFANESFFVKYDKHATIISHYLPVIVAGVFKERNIPLVNKEPLYKGATCRELRYLRNLHY